MIISQHIFDSYIAQIKNSVGTRMFNNFYAEYDGQLEDGLQNGLLSCAFFVSSVLYIWSSLDKPHATITSTIEAMDNAGWHKTSNTKPELGDVLVWEEIKVEPSDDKAQAHIGFFVGNGRAVSTSYIKREVVEHDWLFEGSRKVTMVYRGKNLMSNRIKEIKE